MIYILIMVFMVDRGGTTLTAEFSSLEACQAAGSAIAKQRLSDMGDNYTHLAKSVCVKK